jgi:hypothetical protein
MPIAKKNLASSPLPLQILQDPKISVFIPLVPLIPKAKALRNWKIFLKALSKRLRKLTIKAKRLWRLKYFSFVNVND